MGGSLPPTSVAKSAASHRRRRGASLETTLARQRSPHPTTCALTRTASEKDPAFCAISARRESVILTHGTPSDGLIGSARLFLADGPGELKSVLELCPHDGSALVVRGFSCQGRRSH